MSYPTIIGIGLNSGVTLSQIHQGNASFRKDTSTKHDQIMLLQEVLKEKGFYSKDVDGKYGDGTFTAVKAFQRKYSLTADGVFGQRSLEKLEEKFCSGHLDKSDYGCSEPIEPSDAGPENDDPFIKSEHKNPDKFPFTKMCAARINHWNVSNDRIRNYKPPMTGTLSAKSYLTNLMAKAETSTDYDSLDCSAYTLWARNNKGYSGSTTDFCQHTKYYGYISDLGGYNMLLPGMHLYQAWKHENGKYTTEHVGVYAGRYDFGNGLEHAVYQSSPSYGSLGRMNKKKSSGPNLTSMNNKWNYWAWSKYIYADATTCYNYRVLG